MSAILQVSGVSKRFGSGSEVVQALSGIDMEMSAGDFVAIMGASGSGKSTLLHAIGGLDIPDSGSIRIEGRDLTGMSDLERTLFRRRRLGIVFQAYNLLPTLTAEENIELPLLIDGCSAEEIRRRSGELIEQLHLGHRVSHRPAALSGGEQQRVAIARSLLNDPALVLADEPTGNLDSIQSVEIWELLSKLAADLKKAVIMVTHEAAGASYAGRVVVLKDGRVVGTFDNEDRGDASLVATRYQELAG